MKFHSELRFSYNCNSQSESQTIPDQQYNLEKPQSYLKFLQTLSQIYQAMHLLLVLVLTLFFLSTTSLMNFQPIIWLYWETDIEQAPLVTRVSYEKLVIAANKANWTVNLVTGHNAKNFIPDYQRFEDVVKRGFRSTVQEKSDILRITLVEANGGVWIDFACILYQDLSWLSNQTPLQNLIINRIGTNKEDPDMLIFGEGYHQSPLSYYNQDGVLVNDEYFGNAITFIAAKKKVPIMTAWKQKMYTLTTLSYRQFLPQIQAKRLYFHNIDRDTMYYSGNMALQSVLQQKQMQFDDTLNLTSTRTNVYVHYKIWMLHGQVGPILMTRKHLMNPYGLFFDTIEEINKRAGKVRFFLKIAKFLRDEIQYRQKPSEEYFTQNNITVQQILKRGPSFDQCQLFFIVQNSILHNLYQNSRYSHQIKTPFISVAQRQQLISDCWYKSSLTFLSSHSYRSEGQMTRPERQLLHGKVEGLARLLSYLWVANSLVFWAWFEWFRTFVYLIIVYGVGKYLFSRHDATVVNRMKTQEDGSMEQTTDYKKSPSLQSKVYFMFVGPYVRELILITLLILIVSAMLQFYQELQDMGKYPQYECTLLAILAVFFCRGLLKKLILSSGTGSKFFNFQKIMKDTRYLTFLPLSYCVFLHFDIVYSFAFYHTIVIGGGGLLLYAILEELSQRKFSNCYFDAVRKVQKLSKWAIIAVFLAFYFLPNLRYLRRDNRYVKQNLSEIVLSVFGYTFIIIIASIMASLYNRLKISNSQTEKNEIFHMIFSTVTVGILTIHSHLEYKKIIQSPSSYYLMGNFLFILIAYTLQSVSIRQRLSSQITQSQKKLLFMSNIFQVLWVLFRFFLSSVGFGFLLYQVIVIFREVLPFYVVLVMVLQERTEERGFRTIGEMNSQTFQEVQLNSTVE